MFSLNALCTKDEVNYFGNGAGLIQGAINVMDWDQSGELSHPKSAVLHVLPVNEFASGPRVHKGIQGFNPHGLCGFHFHFQPEGLWVVFGGSNDKLGWELSFPFGVVSLRGV